jgi:hypothetical protein
MSCDLSILDFSVGNLHTYTTVSIHWSNDVLVRQNSIILDVRGMFIALTCPHLFFFVMYKIIFFCGQLCYTVGFRLDSRQLFVDCHDLPKNDTRIEANLTLTSHIAWISCPSIPQSMNMWKSYHVRFPFFFASLDLRENWQEAYLLVSWGTIWFPLYVPINPAMASELDFSKLLPSIGGLVYGTIHRKKAWKNAQKTMISWRFSYGFPWFPMFLRRPEVVLVPASGTRRRRDGQKIGDPTYQEVGDVHVHISLYVSDINIYIHIIYIYIIVYIYIHYCILYIYIYIIVYIYILLIYIYTYHMTR